MGHRTLVVTLAERKMGNKLDNDVVLEGFGTLEEMEAHVILELNERGSLTDEVVGSVAYDKVPPEEGVGAYRVRIPSLN